MKQQPVTNPPEYSRWTFLEGLFIGVLATAFVAMLIIGGNSVSNTRKVNEATTAGQEAGRIEGLKMLRVSAAAAGHGTYYMNKFGETSWRWFEPSEMATNKPTAESWTFRAAMPANFFQ